MKALGPRKHVTTGCNLSLTSSLPPLPQSLRLSYSPDSQAAGLRSARPLGPVIAVCSNIFSPAESPVLYPPVVTCNLATS